MLILIIVLLFFYNELLVIWVSGRSRMFPKPRRVKINRFIPKYFNKRQYGISKQIVIFYRIFQICSYIYSFKSHISITYDPGVNGSHLTMSGILTISSFSSGGGWHLLHISCDTDSPLHNRHKLHFCELMNMWNTCGYI